MKQFIKGALTTIVEDDDRRIPDYRAGGWKEDTVKQNAPTDAADKALDKAMNDTAKKKGKGATVPDKKVNDAIKANNEASAESEAVDDGLIAGEDK